MRHTESVDDELRPRFGGGGGGSGGASAALAARLARRRSVSSPKRPGGGAAVQRTDTRQRVVVKTSFHLHAATSRSASPGRLREHLRYLQREAAELNDGPPKLFSSDPEASVERNDVVSEWAQDRHHYRVILSPENGSDLGSVEEYTRRVVAAWEERLGHDLEWVAVTHNNTDQPHAHLVIRGVVEGRNLKLSSAMVKHGMRADAEAVATLELGPRTLDQIREAYRAQVPQMRVTELDRVLQRGMQGGRVDVRHVVADREVRTHLVGRLQTLSRMGLASHSRGHVYRLERDFVAKLGAVEERNRVGSEVRRHFGAEAARVVSFHRDGPREEVVGRVTKRGLTEGGRRAFVAMRAARGPVYVEVPATHAPPVEEGGVVRISARPAPRVSAAFGAAIKRGVVTHAELAEAGEAGEVLRTKLEALVQAGDARRRRRGYSMEAAQATALARELNLEAIPPRVRVVASRDPGIGLDADRWNAMDGYVRRAETPTWPGGAELLAGRVAHLDRSGLVWRDDSEVVRFKKGVTQSLREAERVHAGGVAARRLGLRESGAGAQLDGVSRLVERVELAQGPAVVLERDGALAVELLADVRELQKLNVGAEVAVRRETGGRGVRLEPASLEREGGR